MTIPWQGGRAILVQVCQGRTRGALALSLGIVDPERIQAYEDTTKIKKAAVAAFRHCGGGAAGAGRAGAGGRAGRRQVVHRAGE